MEIQQDRCLLFSTLFVPLFGHSLFCRLFKICRDLRTFWNTLGKKRVRYNVYRAKNALLHMVYIAYCTELATLQLRAKTTHLSRK